MATGSVRDFMTPPVMTKLETYLYWYFKYAVWLPIKIKAAVKGGIKSILMLKGTLLYVTWHQSNPCYLVSLPWWQVQVQLISVQQRIEKEKYITFIFSREQISGTTWSVMELSLQKASGAILITGRWRPFLPLWVTPLPISSSPRSRASCTCLSVHQLIPSGETSAALGPPKQTLLWLWPQEGGRPVSSMRWVGLTLTSQTTRERNKYEEEKWKSLFLPEFGLKPWNGGFEKYASVII